MKSILKISVVIICALVFLGIFVFCQTQLYNTANEFSSLLALILSLNSPILLLVIISYFFKKRYSISKAQLGFYDKIFLKNFIKGALISAFIIGLSVGVLDILYKICIIKQVFYYKPILFIVVNAIIIGSNEELFFRGFINNFLKINMVSTRKTIIISSLIFSMVHLLSFDFNNTSIFWFIGIFLMGILFSFLYLETNSIFISIGCHILWDVFSFILNGYYDFNYIKIDKFNTLSIPLDNIETIVIFLFLSTYLYKTKLYKLI